MNTVEKLQCTQDPLSVYEETARAYADCTIGGKEGGKLRNLNFRASAPLRLLEWMECMKRATPEGYNQFNAVRVGRVLAQLGVSLDAVFIPAREYSVCVYVRADGWLLQHILNNAAALQADEADIVDGELRLWWD